MCDDESSGFLVVRVVICYSLLGVLFSKEDKYEMLVLIVVAPRFFDMICWQVKC
jgi:hypothetical protein